MKKLFLALGLMSMAAVAANYSRFDSTIVKNSESIGSNAPANSKSIFDLTSTTKGMLPPRMTTTQRDAISSPPEALSIYNMSTHYADFYNGSAWQDILSMSSRSSATGVLAITSGVVSAGSVSATDITGILSSAHGGTSANLSASNGPLVITSGTVAASSISLTTQVSGVLPIVNGGTNNGSLAVTAGGVVYTDGSKENNTGAGSTGQVLTSQGSSAPIWAAASGGGSAGINILSGKNNDAELGATTNWTASAGTFTVDDTAANVGNGTWAFSWDASATSQTVTSNAVAIPAGLYGQNCELKFHYKGFDSNIAAQVYDGSNVVDNGNATVTLSAATTYQWVKIFFPCPTSGNLQMRLLSSGNAAIGYWDDVHLGEAIDIGDSQISTAWTAYTPTFSAGFGTVTNNSAFYRRVGDSLEVAGSLTTGTRGATIMSISLPSGLSINTSKITLGNTTSADGQEVGQFEQTGASAHFAIVTATGTSSSLVYVGAVYSSAAYLTPALGTTGGLTNTTNSSYWFRVPIAGWSGVTVVRPDQADFGWTSYTPTLTGFGTVASTDFKYKRVGDSLFITGYWTNGTVAGSLASITLPSGLSIDTTKINRGNTTSTGGVAVGISRDEAASNVKFVVTATGTDATKLYFGNLVGNGSGLTPQNGSTISSNSQLASISVGPLPISGWSDNQRAPALVNSILTGSNGSTKIGSFYLASGCLSATTNNESLFVSGSKNGTGDCTSTITSGYFSSAPVCTCAGDSSSANECGVRATTSTTVRTLTATGAGVTDMGVMVICMGPR